MTEDIVVAQLRRAWRATLARHEADRLAGREIDGARALAERFLALLADKPVGGADAVADMGLRATLAATIMGEVEVMERAER